MTRHEHDWSPWGEWYFFRGNTEARDRDCQDPDCGDTDTQYRDHEHNFRCTMCLAKEK